MLTLHTRIRGLRTGNRLTPPLSELSHWMIAIDKSTMLRFHRMGAFYRITGRGAFSFAQVFMLDESGW